MVALSYNHFIKTKFYINKKRSPLDRLLPPAAVSLATIYHFGGGFWCIFQFQKIPLLSERNRFLF